MPNAFEINYNLLIDEASSEVVKQIYNFNDILVQVTEKNDPSILSRYLIDLAKSFSVFYNENKIICEDKELQSARTYLTYAVGKTLKLGAKLLGIEMPNRM